MAPRSVTSWTLPEHSRARPAPRTLMTSEWSPKMDRAWVATVRAATWKTTGASSPPTLNMTGIMSRRPWLEVKVVARAPVETAPCRAPAAPASLCISTTLGTTPNRLGLRAAAQASQASPMLEEGVMG